MTATTETSARCDCGALTVDIKGAPVVQLVCHCEDCRASSGMPYTEGAFFQPSDCTIQGEADTSTIKGGTGFDKTLYSCTSCKTQLYMTIAALNGACAVMAKRLSPFKFDPQIHVWTSEKADEVTIPEGVTQYSEAPNKEMAAFLISNFWRKT
jgi:hypothetical protein